MSELLPNDRVVMLSPATGATTLDYDFELTRPDGLTITRIRNDAQQTLVFGVDYAFPGGLGSIAGGTVTLLAPTLASDRFILAGYHPIERTSDFLQSSRFAAVKFNSQLDALTIIAQENRRDIGRALKLDFGSNAVAAQRLLASDGRGNVIDGGDMKEIADLAASAAASRDAVAEDRQAVADDLLDVIAMQILAAAWAAAPEDVPVQSGKFSAFHWAQKAAAASGLAYTPVNRAGDTMTGPLTTEDLFAGYGGTKTLVSGVAIEVALNRTTDGGAYLDLHATPSSDFDARLARNGGVNGAFQIINNGSGPVDVNIGGMTVGRFDASGVSLYGHMRAFAPSGTAAASLYLLHTDGTIRGSIYSPPDKSVVINFGTSSNFQLRAGDGAALFPGNIYVGPALFATDGGISGSAWAGLGGTPNAIASIAAYIDARIPAVIAAMAVGAPSTYATLWNTVNEELTAGSLRAGSTLRYSNANGGGTGTPSGTWMLMADLDIGSGSPRSATWLRIL